MTSAVADLAADFDGLEGEGPRGGALAGGDEDEFLAIHLDDRGGGDGQGLLAAELSRRIRTNIPALSKPSGFSVSARSGTVRVWGSTTDPTEMSRAWNSRPG